MKMYRRYTEEEDKVIFSEVKNSPENLSRAFRRASEKIGRTPNAIAGRWYYIKHREVCFVTFSENKSFVNNIKTAEDTKKVGKSLWSRLLKLLKWNS